MTERINESLLELITLIYDSVANGSGWQVFLAKLAIATCHDTAVMNIGDPRWDEFSFACWHGLSEEEVRLYLSLVDEKDQWVEAARTLPEGTVAPSHELWDVADMVGSALYQKFLGPRDFFYGMGGIIWVTKTSRSTISVTRRKHLGPCKEPELSILRELMPHLRRAAQLHGELTSLRSQRSAFTDHLDRYPQAFVLTDAKAGVLFANLAASKIASSRDGITIAAGRLIAQSAFENTALHEAIREIAALPNAPRRRLAVTRSSMKLAYRLLLMPIHSSSAVPLGVSQPAVAILIIDSEATSSPNVAMLQDLFSLTGGEARVVARLVQGRSVDEVATELKISVETVRTHVRRVLVKTATSRQGELISLVLRTVPSEAL